MTNNKQLIQQYDTEALEKLPPIGGVIDEGI